jgi:hypothetical protein
MGVTQTVMQITENNVLKSYGRVVSMGDNRWPMRILTWSRMEEKGEEDPK